jgi:mitochondrial fission protein ELM1
MKHVWILDEGSQGHLVQSRGLVRELSKQVPLAVVEVPITCALPRRLSRSLVKRLLRVFRRRWMFRLLHPRMELPGGKPDLIISSGPHSLAALEFLSKNHGCPGVFVQGTLSVPEGTVTAIMRPFEGEHRADYIFIPLLFTEITPQVVEQAGNDFLAQNAVRPRGPINTLFIGNSSAKIRFSHEDWAGIARFVNDLWKRDGSQWLVSTSYRTGGALEDIFRETIEPDAMLDAVWYSTAPRKVTKPFLGLADRVFVTMDSLTMLTEAVASGRQVFALCPAAMNDDSSNTHLRYVRELAEKGLVTLIRPGRDAVPPPGPRMNPQIDYSDAIHQLLVKLEWKT